jgi:threonine/homoserine/homoserine lactone efflux protein
VAEGSEKTTGLIEGSGITLRVVVSSTHFLTFSAFAFLMVIVPGPSVLFTISQALTIGRRDALLTVVGNAAGVYLQVVAVAWGLGALVMASASVFTAIKLCGAVYLVYLGAQAFRRRRRLAEALSGGIDTTRRLVVGFANPKSIVFLAALLPQFINTAKGSIPVQMMVLGICVPVFGLVSTRCGQSPQASPVTGLPDPRNALPWWVAPAVC